MNLKHAKLGILTKKNLIVFSIFLFFCGSAFAETGSGKSLADIATNIMDSFKALGELMIAVAYLSGFGFTIASIFKFKQHKDNPTQIPVSTPLALLMVGIVLIFLPGIIRPSGVTIFGTGVPLEQMAGGFKGEGAQHLPGGE